MNRAAQGVVLLLVGGALLRTGLTELYLRYVREGMRPLLITAGVVLVALAVATLLPEFVRTGARAGEPEGPAEQEPDGDPDHGDSGHGDSGHGGHPEPVASWLMLLPVLALLLVTPPALGADAVARGGTAVGSAKVSDYPPLPQGDPVKLTVLDYAARAVFERGASLGHRRVELTGFIVVNSDGRRFLARMVLSCCAADARPVKVGLTGEVAQLSQETWVRVVGRYSDLVVADQVNGETIPFLVAESVTRIPAPKDQYE